MPRLYLSCIDVCSSYRFCIPLLYEMLVSGCWKPTTPMGLKEVGECFTWQNVPDLRKLDAEPQACSKDEKPLWFTEMLFSNASAPC